MQDKPGFTQSLWDMQSPWKRIRTEYSRKTLTKPSDKLAAFSGIASMVFKALASSSDEYLAGIWKPNLLSELLWERDGDQEAPYDPELYIAPTWLWASLNGAFRDSGYIEMSLELNGLTRQDQWHCEVLDAQVTPVADIFGPVKADNMTLKTWLCRIEIWSPKERTFRSIMRESDWNISAINGVAASYSGMISIDHPTPEIRRFSVLLSFYFVPVRSIYREGQTCRISLEGLLLKRTGKRQGQYYRDGLLRLLFQDEEGDKAFRQFQQSDSTESAHYLESLSGGVHAIEII
ncbi:MAG: hypothetical protein OHK93_000753 [Ramalina farinacea]|uniref:Uncharacterized protein n=1 Tax=Ramalina farinacea TaxID=258253 RepID=A0AA43TS83_9LECA|nr:hypothetical protein [Ramalina farinacea]